MPSVLWIALGGALGSALRYGVALGVGERTSPFPLATLLVNVLGCLAIGFLAIKLGPSTGADTWRPFLITGCLGGFTTYSAFGLEGMQLIQSGRMASALAYIGLHICLGIGAVALGMKLAG